MPEDVENLLCIRAVYPSDPGHNLYHKAAREMKERISALLREEAPHIWISTFHSACVRILRREIENWIYQEFCHI